MSDAIKLKCKIGAINSVRRDGGIVFMFYVNYVERCGGVGVACYS